HYTVYDPEALMNLCYYLLHPLAIGNIAAQDHNFSAVLFDCLQTSYPLANWICSIMRSKPRLPLRSRRHFRSSHENQFCGTHSFREVSSELERNTPYAAG